MTKGISERNVRVTIECTAREISNTGVIRLDLDTSHNDAYPVLLDTSLPNVTVEDITPARVWTDGDVVQGDYAWERRNGRWVSLGNIHWVSEDHEVDGWLTNGGVLRVLRYQAGEQ